jgi:hypothetical protein
MPTIINVNFKMVEAQSCEVDASALLNSGLGLFSFVGFPWLHHVKSSNWYNHDNQSMCFTVGQKTKKCSDVTMETTDGSLLSIKNELQTLLTLGIKDLWIYFNRLVDLHI